MHESLEPTGHPSLASDLATTSSDQASFTQTTNFTMNSAICRYRAYHSKVSWLRGSPCHVSMQNRHSSRGTLSNNGSKEVLQHGVIKMFSSDSKSCGSFSTIVQSIHGHHTSIRHDSYINVIVVRFVLISQVLLPTQIHVFLDCFIFASYPSPCQKQQQNLLVL